MATFQLNGFLELPPNQRDVFIDTGANLGMSMESALNEGFKSVVGIELHEGHCDALRLRFQGNPCTHIVNGSSHDKIDDILNMYRERQCVIWHDAHYQGIARDVEYSPSSGECPVLAELNSVIRHLPLFKFKPLLLIDDAFMFYENFWSDYPQAPLFNRADWPTIHQINNILIPKYSVQLKEHVLVCT